MKATIAIFDLDGVIIRGQSLFYLVRYLLAKKKVSFFYFIKILLWFYLYKVGVIKDAVSARDKFLGVTKGWSVHDSQIFLDDFYVSYLQDKIIKEIRLFIQEHKRAGHLVLIASASIEPLVSIIAKDLEVDFFVASTLKVSNQMYTGVSNEIAYGDRKLQMVKNFLLRSKIVPDETYAYCDDRSDLPLLSFVNHPVVINPSKELKDIAVAKNWKIYDF